jgi:SNF2 family DNA or RNA helicase
MTYRAQMAHNASTCSFVNASEYAPRPQAVQRIGSNALVSGFQQMACSAVPWDLVIVDEAHHCKNRNTLNWKLVNSLQRRQLFLLTATPVQNDLVELYNLLTLLEPGHFEDGIAFQETVCPPRQSAGPAEP